MPQLDPKYFQGKIYPKNKTNMTLDEIMIVV